MTTKIKTPRGAQLATAASVISQMDGLGLNGMTTFIQAIPFNLYAIFTLVRVLVLSWVNLDFGSMLKHMNEAKVGKEGMIGYLVAGFTQNVWLTLATSFIVLLGSVVVLHNITSKEQQVDSTVSPDL